MSLISNLFSENLARSVAFLEELHHSALACAHYMASVATNIHLCFIGNKGKKYPPLQKKTQLLQYISPLGANCPCALSSPAFSIPEDNWFEGPCFKSEAFTLWLSALCNISQKKKAQDPHLLCQTTALWKATQTCNKLYQQKRRGVKNICNHMPNAEREEVTLRFLSEMSVWTQAC